MDTAAEIEEREDNDGNSAFYNTRTQVWGWTREEVEENIEERVRLWNLISRMHNPDAVPRGPVP